MTRPDWPKMMQREEVVPWSIAAMHCLVTRVPPSVTGEVQNAKMSSRPTSRRRLVGARVRMTFDIGEHHDEIMVTSNRDVNLSGEPLPGSGAEVAGYRARGLP